MSSEPHPVAGIRCQAGCQTCRGVQRGAAMCGLIDVVCQQYLSGCSHVQHWSLKELRMRIAGKKHQLHWPNCFHCTTKSFRRIPHYGFSLELLLVALFNSHIGRKSAHCLSTNCSSTGFNDNSVQPQHMLRLESGQQLQSRQH